MRSESGNGGSESDTGLDQNSRDTGQNRSRQEERVTSVRSPDTVWGCEGWKRAQKSPRGQKRAQKSHGYHRVTRDSTGSREMPQEQYRVTKWVTGALW